MAAHFKSDWLTLRRAVMQTGAGDLNAWLEQYLSTVPPCVMRVFLTDVG